MARFIARFAPVSVLLVLGVTVVGGCSGDGESERPPAQPEPSLSSSIAADDLDEELPIPTEALIGDVVSASWVMGVWMVDVEVDLSREQAFQAASEALERAGMPVIGGMPAQRGWTTQLPYYVVFSIGQGRLTLVHYEISEPSTGAAELG